MCTSLEHYFKRMALNKYLDNSNFCVITACKCKVLFAGPRVVLDDMEE
jgi:hypothetical protein